MILIFQSQGSLWLALGKRKKINKARTQTQTRLPPQWTDCVWLQGQKCTPREWSFRPNSGSMKRSHLLPPSVIGNGQLYRLCFHGWGVCRLPALGGVSLFCFFMVQWKGGWLSLFPRVTWGQGMEGVSLCKRRAVSLTVSSLRTASQSLFKVWTSNIKDVNALEGSGTRTGICKLSHFLFLNSFWNKNEIPLYTLIQAECISLLAVASGQIPNCQRIRETPQLILAIGWTDDTCYSLHLAYIVSQYWPKKKKMWELETTVSFVSVFFFAWAARNLRLCPSVQYLSLKFSGTTFLLLLSPLFSDGCAF